MSFKKLFKEVLITCGQDCRSVLFENMVKAASLFGSMEGDIDKLHTSMLKNIICSKGGKESTVAALTLTASVDMILDLLRKLSENPVITTFDIREFVRNYDS